MVERIAWVRLAGVERSFYVSGLGGGVLHDGELVSTDLRRSRVELRRAFGLLAAAAATSLAVAGGWWATRPPPPDPLETWRGPSPDPHENRLRKLTFDGGGTARLRVPTGWRRTRSEPLVVLLGEAGASGAATAARFPGLMDGPWLLLLPEGGAPLAEGIARVQREYATNPDRILLIGEGSSAAEAEAVGCSGGDAIVLRTSPPCGQAGTAWAWIADHGAWRPVDEPADPGGWLAEAVVAWNGR